MTTGARHASVVSTLEKLQGSNKKLLNTVLGLPDEAPANVISSKTGGPTSSNALPTTLNEKSKETYDAYLEARNKWESEAGIAFLRELPNSWSIMVTFFKSFSNLLLGITTILFLWLPVEIMSMCFAVYMICKPFFSAIYHAVLSIVLGRKLLLRTPHRYPIWHSSSLPAALVGAVGGIIVVLLGSLAFIAGPRLFWRKEAAQFTARRFWLLAIAIRMFTSALAGALGSAVLLLAEVDIKDLNVLHSAYYGAVGGAYFSVCLSIISKVAKVVGRRQQTRVPNSEPRV